MTTTLTNTQKSHRKGLVTNVLRLLEESTAMALVSAETERNDLLFQSKPVDEINEEIQSLNVILQNTKVLLTINS